MDYCLADPVANKQLEGGVRCLQGSAADAYGDVSTASQGAVPHRCRLPLSPVYSVSEPNIRGCFLSPLEGRVISSHGIQYSLNIERRDISRNSGRQKANAPACLRIRATTTATTPTELQQQAQQSTTRNSQQLITNVLFFCLSGFGLRFPFPPTL